MQGRAVTMPLSRFNRPFVNIADRNPSLRIPTAADVSDAVRALAGIAVRTPLITNETLDKAVGARVFLKPENLQYTGSFKFRGA